MPVGTDVVRGVLKLEGLLDEKCFTSWQEFVSAIPSLFAVELPNNITNVTVGATQPSDSERDHLWVKKDGSGSFVGLFIYAQGDWQQVYPAPNQLFLMYGDSRAMPAGYILASDDPNISTLELVNLQKIWTEGGVSPTWWTVFHAVYKGF